jgi:hypothetical protein
VLLATELQSLRGPEEDDRTFRIRRPQAAAAGQMGLVELRKRFTRVGGGWALGAILHAALLTQHAVFLLRYLDLGDVNETLGAIANTTSLTAFDWSCLMPSI